MKKKYMIAAAVLTMAVALTGCGGKKENETDKGEGTGEVTQEEALDFDVKEYVKLGDYKGLEVTYPAPAEVTDDEVQTYIQEQLEENTEYKEAEGRAAQEGDSVNIDYTGTLDGEEFEGGSDTGYDLVIGSEDFLPDFENSLIGKKAGETAVFKLTFPEDYDETLGGQEVEFTVKVNSVSEVVVPEYNEDFVKSVSDFETLADYEASIKEELIASAKEDSEMEAGENALRLAMENAELKGYPQKLYDFFYNDSVSGYQAYAEMLGMDYEEFLESFMSEDDIKEVVQDQVDEYLLTQAILEQEGQEITDEDYQTLGAEMAAENEYDTLEEFETDYGKTYIKTQLIRERAVKLLQESANLSEVSYDEYYQDEELEVEE